MSANPSGVVYAVFDIDGVLADVRHRLGYVQRAPKDWDRFFNAAPADAVLADGLAAVGAEVSAGRTVVYVTGRPERCRQDTVGWLVRHGFPAGSLTMRGDHDRRPARLLKPELVRALNRTGSVAVMYDDDESVVTALRAHGVPVVHAQWMSTEAQEALFSVQEIEGRS